MNIPISRLYNGVVLGVESLGLLVLLLLLLDWLRWILYDTPLFVLLKDNLRWWWW